MVVNDGDALLLLLLALVLVLTVNLVGDRGSDGDNSSGGSSGADRLYITPMWVMASHSLPLPFTIH